MCCCQLLTWNSASSAASSALAPPAAAATSSHQPAAPPAAAAKIPPVASALSHTNGLRSIHLEGIDEGERLAVFWVASSPCLLGRGHRSLECCDIDRLSGRPGEAVEQ